MRVVIDYKLDNLNDTINKCRSNYKYANKVKQNEMAICKLFLRNVKPITNYPIKLNCEWHVKNLGSDLDNKMLKSVLDSMQELGILENDNIKHINEINHKAVKDNKDYLVIDIIENRDDTQ